MQCTALRIKWIESVFVMENNFDVIIVGCGAAGLYGAINLPSDCRILLLCKQDLTLCNSDLAQGGIAGVYNSPGDSIELHEHDTMVAGGFQNNPETVHILTTHAAHEIQAILDMGVDFDRTADGELHRTLEGATPVTGFSTTKMQPVQKFWTS